MKLRPHWEGDVLVLDSGDIAAAVGSLNYRGNWAPFTDYAVNDAVKYNGGLYVAPAAFTSGSAYSSSNWVELVAQFGTYATRNLRVVNALDNQYANIAANGTTNDAAAWQALLDAVALESPNGALITFKGRSRILTALNWHANVGLVGHGYGKSVLAVEGNVHGITGGGSSGSLMANTLFEDFEIDCSAQTGLAKAMFLTYMRRMTVNHVYAHDVGASAFGCDYLVDSTFFECLVENAGVNGTTSSPGCSGYGIGTGVFDVENVSLVDCTARGCKRYGAFFEHLSAGTFYSKGAKVIGGRYESNNRGIGDNGSRRLVISGAHISSNTDVGVYVGADQSSNPGYDGLIEGCQISDNGTHGVHLDSSVGAQNGRYVVKGNRVSGNTTIGVKASASGTLPNIVVVDNDIHEQGAAGIQLTGGTFIDPVVAGNRIWSNGQTNVSGAAQAILIGGNLTRPKITDNKTGDPGGAQKQTYGLQIGSSLTIAGGVIADNDFTNNLTGAVNLLSTPTSGASGTRIRNNAGYNPIGWDTLTVSASPWSYTAGPTEEVVNLLNGTVSNVAVTDRTGTTTNVALSAPASIPLAAYDVMVVTYSSAPIAKRLRK